MHPKAAPPLQSDAGCIYHGGPVGSFIHTGLIAKTAGSGSSSTGNSPGFEHQSVVGVRTGTSCLPDNCTSKGTPVGNGAFSTTLQTKSGHVAPAATSRPAPRSWTSMPAGN